MISGDSLPKIKQNILAGLAIGPVRFECVRAKKLARELRKELQMCDIVVEVEDVVTASPIGVMATPGVIRVSWKKVL